MLPLCALPCRALPCRALHLIREYSKPLTRPDWRTFERSITSNIFIHEIDTLLNFKNIINLFKNENIYSIVDDHDQIIFNVY